MVILLSPFSGTCVSWVGTVKEGYTLSNGLNAFKGVPVEYNVVQSPHRYINSVGNHAHANFDVLNFLSLCTALYDDRMVRSHVRRTRDLISTASIHSSLSTALAMEYEAKQAGAEGGFCLSVVCTNCNVFISSCLLSKVRF